jgi:hypothetical protein
MVFIYVFNKHTWVQHTIFEGWGLQRLRQDNSTRELPFRATHCPEFIKPEIGLALKMRGWLSIIVARRPGWPHGAPENLNVLTDPLFVRDVSGLQVGVPAYRQRFSSSVHQLQIVYY